MENCQLVMLIKLEFSKNLREYENKLLKKLCGLYVSTNYKNCLLITVGLLDSTHNVT